MPDSFTQVQPPMAFIPPDFNPLVWSGCRCILPTWMRWSSHIQTVEVEGTEQLVELYQQFQTGKTRLMVAFRHPSPDDPYCMMRLLAYEVPRTAKQMGVPLKSPIHAHFIYDRGIPLWAGGYVGWIYSKLGGIPIKRGRTDLMSLRTVRQLFTDGEFPMAAAPEGATNGQSEIVSPIEPGIAQFGFWCLEDLRKADRAETVQIVPIGIRYYYTDAPWESLENLLRSLELDSGITHAQTLGLQNGVTPTAEQQVILYERLLHLGEHLLTAMEEFYCKYYHQKIKGLEVKGSDGAAGVKPPLAERLPQLLDAALTVAEEFFDIPPKGNLTDRCRRLEQAAWDRIFREDLKSLEDLSPVERSLADRIAEEADLRIWHMRLVESFVSVTGSYVAEKPSAERFAETLLLLRDMVERLKGNSPYPPPNLGDRQVKITVGSPISISDQWDAYRANRRQAVTDLTLTLQNTLESMIGT